MGTTPVGNVVEANGARIYCERRGRGPAVLCIAGATGDAGHYERVAELLADAFTVVTYDRRGNSRSPRPDGWAGTSTEEQAEDAAALLAALGLAPALVFGSSAGAIIGLDLALRHPGVVRGAILHEPPLAVGLADPAATLAAIQRVVEGGLQRGGPRGGVEAFVRFAAGDAAFEHLDPQLRDRMLGNGETLFGAEMAAFPAYRPSDAALATLAVPVQVLAGTASPFGEAARWLASRLNVEAATLPGGHTPYFDRPEELAATLRPLLQGLAPQPDGVRRP